MDYGMFRAAAVSPKLKVADTTYNTTQIKSVIDKAVAENVRLLVTPELSVTGVHDEPSVTAVRWLQQLSGLPATGEIDQTTWAYLTGLYALTTGDGDFSMPETVSH